MATGSGSWVSPPLFALVERTVEGLGYTLVDLERGGGGLLRVTLDLSAERFEPAAGDDPTAGVGPTVGIGIADCERVSHQLTHLFAVEDIEYQRLEVSSPGLDRRLRSARDFRRFSGAAVSVHLTAPRDGRRRLRARVVEVTGEPGAERLTLALLPDLPEGAVIRAGAGRRAGAPARLASESAGARRGAGKGRSNAKAVSAEAARGSVADARTAGASGPGAPEPTLELALSEIDKARLIPVIDFRGAGRAQAAG